MILRLVIDLFYAAQIVALHFSIPEPASATPSASITLGIATVGALRDPRLPFVTPSASDRAGIATVGALRDPRLPFVTPSRPIRYRRTHGYQLAPSASITLGNLRYPISGLLLRLFQLVGSDRQPRSGRWNRVQNIAC